MKVLFLIVNSVCNIWCTYCFYSTGHEKRDKHRVRPRDAAAVADRIISAGFGTVILTGGDPLQSGLKRETYVLMRELKVRGCKIILNTSGACVTDDDLDTLVALDIDRIDVSIDSHDAAIHDAQRGRHADSLRTIEGLFARGYLNVVTTTVVTPLNAPTLGTTITWLRSLGVKDVRIQRAFLPKEAAASVGDTVTEHMRSCASMLNHASHIQKYIELTERAFRKEVPTNEPRCLMGKRYFVCGANGVLTPCFHRSDIVLGNLFSDPIDQLLASLEQHELLGHELPPCFGRHCVSLFDNPRFWRTTDDQLPSGTAPAVPEYRPEDAALQ